MVAVTHCMRITPIPQSLMMGCEFDSRARLLCSEIMSMITLRSRSRQPSQQHHGKYRDSHATDVTAYSEQGSAAREYVKEIHIF